MDVLTSVCGVMCSDMTSNDHQASLGRLIYMTIAGIGMPFLTDEEVLRIGACGLSLAGGREHVEP
jgi:hypothetical protein